MSDLTKDLDLIAYILVPVKLDLDLTATEENFVRSLSHNGLGRNVFVANEESIKLAKEKFPTVNKLLLEALTSRFSTIKELLVCLSKLPLET